MTIDSAVLNSSLLESEFIICEYRNGTQPDNVKVQEYLQQLERVPLGLQEIIANEGSYIVFFNGAITDNPEMRHVKGVRPRNWDRYTWDNVCAAHDSSSKAILIGIEGDYVGMDDPFLHEFGHSFDDRVGEHLRSYPMSEWSEVLQALKSEPFPKSYHGHPREYVANSVDLFYRSDRTNRQLSGSNPSMFQLLRELESI
ncbi:MAG: hypothetical protein PVJ67_06995 [Candidatus Pacearchaeota archaeon]|jgi:hypothetical protein